MEQIGIIKGIKIGIRDTSKCICWFELKGIEGSSLQCISMDAFVKIIEKHQIYDFSKLEGAAAIYESNEQQRTMIFKDLFI